jgi:tetratricopeptide (TPR) repeat protein
VATDDVSSLSELGTRNRYQVLAVCGCLLLAVGVVFGQTVRSGFVNFDDGLYVYGNAHVLHGLSPREIVWAFTRLHAGYWIPLTWISFMLDSQLYGPGPGGYHFSNVLLHAATTILLFLVLRQMTGRSWPSALVAALFAVHPLHVESVAWVTERKDLLSGLFFLLALWAYLGYVRRPAVRGQYAAVVIFFLLSLLAKPMLVTLPLVLLLLDYWPLGRMTDSACRPIAPHCNGEAVVGEANSLPAPVRRFPFFWPLVIEKLPLFLVAAVFCLLTAGTEGKAAGARESFHFSWQVGNALVSYVAYLGQLFYPLGLAVFYPHPGGDLPVWKVAGAAVALACISAAALSSWRRCPYLLMGWLWYLVTLLPVIGLMQVGGHAMADRFTYVTQIGLYIALVWGMADVLCCRPYRGWLGGSASALVLAVLMGCAWRQASFWSDTETLFVHTAACTPRNFVAYHGLGRLWAERGKFDVAMSYYRKSLESKPDNAAAYDGMGLALVARGQPGEAIAWYRKALEIEPDDPTLHDDLGSALAACGRFEEAVEQHRKALWLDPQDPTAHYNLANALAALGKLDEAIERYQTALQSQPDNVQAYNNLGIALASRGRLDEAVVQFEQGLKIKPQDVGLHSNLANALSALGRHAEALLHYQTALKIQPNQVDTQKNLAWLRATCPEASLRNGAEALELAQRANRLCGGKRPDVLDCLAAAYAAVGWFPEALVTSRQALELARQQHAHALAAALQARIALYEAGKPFYQTPPSTLAPPPAR